MQADEKEMNYTKWDSSIWNSVQKEISLFQRKVTDCMLLLGDLKKDRLEDFIIEPCLEDEVVLGEKFYTELIRPFCVAKGYLPKNKPTPEEVADIEFEEERLKRMQLAKRGKQESREEEKKAKKGKGGKGKKQNSVSEQEMRTKIVKDNFQRDIEIISKSQSMQRMQIESGMKSKKLQLKLITFFYIACYIRKNKLAQKINESEIFELVNILIKVVRIFSLFEGPSFMDNTCKIEVSPTLILDLKLCIKHLKEHYHYTNKTIIIKHPKLVYYTSYDRFFPTLDIKPYPSQIEFIQAVKKAFEKDGTIVQPTLVFYRTMIGSGKTSASLALSQLLRDCKFAKATNDALQVLYTCLISSVRMQVGRYCYSKKQRFALAAMQRSILDNQYFYPRIVNSWSCINDKYVDLVISDLHCAYEMLDRHLLTDQEEEIMGYQRQNRKHKVERGMLNRENLVLFVDEPTAYCKDVNSKATKKLFDILANYPPKIIILASATMPSKNELTKTIELVARRNQNLRVVEVESKQFAIGCQFCSFQGEVIFPHTGAKNRDDLARIVGILRKNAFLLKLYTGPSLFFLLRKCEQVGIRDLPSIDLLPQVRQEDITRASFVILEKLLQQADNVIAQVCAKAKDENVIDFNDDLLREKDKESQLFDMMMMENDDKEEKEEEEEEPQQTGQKAYVDFKRMLRGDAYKFLGGCLIGVSDPLQFARDTFERWVRKIQPIKRLMEKYERDKNELAKEIRSIEEEVIHFDKRLGKTDENEKKNDKTERYTGLSKEQKISKLQSEKEPRLQFPDHKKINTSEHYAKYCKDKESLHLSMLIKPIPIENLSQELIDKVEDFVLKLLFCGIAIYTQRGLPAKYLDKVEELASQNFLAFIICDESLCYGTNFPISTVILRDDLASRLNMNEIFQLIGRAGRVGQSWTARAFLEKIGLQKLQDYIHKPESQTSQQARIFEAIAEEHLNYPALRLRNLTFEVRYRDGIEQSGKIEMLIKKKDQAQQKLNHIMVVPFTRRDHKVYYLAALTNGAQLDDKDSVKRYNLPASALAYEDMPTILNAKQEQIIDIAFFSSSFKTFLKITVDKAVKRIITSEIGDVASTCEVLNHFEPKVYEPYFCSMTNTLAILVKVDSDKKQVNRYCFQELAPNTLGEPDQAMLSRLTSMINDATEIAEKVLQNPMKIEATKGKKLIENHKEFLSRKEQRFYADIVTPLLDKAKCEYDALIENFLQKELLELKQESIVALALSKCSDLLNCYDRLFHIPQQIRPIWKHLESQAWEL